MFVSSLRQEIPESQQSTYLLSSQNMEMLRDDMGMSNMYVGYVYLVDPNLKVRWAGSGRASAKDGEAEALEKCAGVLLRREKSPGDASRVSKARA